MSFWHSGFVEMIPTDNVLSGTDQRNLLIFEDATYSNVRNFFYGNVVGKKQSVNFSCYSDGMINTSYPPYKIILKRAQYASSGNLDFGTGLDSTMAGIYDNLYNIEHNPEFEAAYVQFFHIVRYAHTLLTYAEASARSGNPDFLAYEALNKVRRRAYKLPINTPSVYDLPSGLSAIAFADSVVKERGWEFCHEFEGRWNDILRLQLYPQIEADRVNEFQSGLVDRTYNGQTYFLPIPQTDIWLNPYLESNDSE